MSTDTALVPAVGDRIKFMPQRGNRWWLVRARDARFIVATQQRPFFPKGELLYTVVDLTGWTSKYNGVGPGKVRSSLNTLGGGAGDVADISTDEGCLAILAALQSGEWELSRRRVVGFDRMILSEAAR